MKKLLKNPIITFILGAIIFSCITGVGASVLYSSSEVGFTPTDSNWKVNNLEDAINDLYTNKNISFGQALYATSQGDRVANRTATLSLTKGKYLIIDDKEFDFHLSGTSYPSTYSEAPASGADYRNLSCSSNNCVTNLLSAYYNRVRSSASSSLGYHHVVAFTFTYYVEIKEDNDEISAYINDGVTTYNGEIETLHAIPIN